MSDCTPEELLTYLADRLVRQTFWQIMFSVRTGYGMPKPLALISPIIAETIAAAGWPKADVKRFLFAHARMPDWTRKPIWNLTEEAHSGNTTAVLAESDDPNRLVLVVWAPEHFMVVTSGYVFVHNGQLGFPGDAEDRTVSGLRGHSPARPSLWFIRKIGKRQSNACLISARAR